MRKMSDIVRHQDPLTLPANATVKDACRHMRDRRVGAVLVTEQIIVCSEFSPGVTRSPAYWRKVRVLPGPRCPTS